MKIRLSSNRQIRFGLNRNIESIGCIMPRLLQAISSLTTEIWLLKTDVVTESVAFGTITIYVNDSFGLILLTNVDPTAIPVNPLLHASATQESFSRLFD